jgi:hypothetical protein
LMMRIYRSHTLTTNGSPLAPMPTYRTSAVA